MAIFFGVYGSWFPPYQKDRQLQAHAHTFPQPCPFSCNDRPDDKTILIHQTNVD